VPSPYLLELGRDKYEEGLLRSREKKGLLYSNQWGERMEGIIIRCWLFRKFQGMELAFPDQLAGIQVHALAYFHLISSISIW
jgi:hypothetical protein